MAYHIKSKSEAGKDRHGPPSSKKNEAKDKVGETKTRRKRMKVKKWLSYSDMWSGVCVCP